MKSICGIIAEYNPLHRGHAYHLRAARQASGCAYLLVVMSGPFVQRGEPAILDKFDRARMAAAAGADLVIELPVLFATSHAQGFAAGGIGLLSTLGVDAVSFGAECADAQLLQRAARLLAQEPPAFSQALRRYLERGLSHPQARAQALRDMDPVCGALLDRSNNVLAVEYLQSIERLGAALKVFPILRQGGDYRQENPEPGCYASATALRQQLAQGRIPWEDIPAAVRPIWTQALEKARPVFPRALDIPVRLALRGMSLSALDALPDASEGLPRRLAKLAQESTGFEDLVRRGMTRRYSQARIQRTLLHALLGITQTDAAMLRRPPPLYAHVLAMGSAGGALLGELHRRSRLPIITQPASFAPSSPEQARLWTLDRYASDVYAILQGRAWGVDYTQKRAPLSIFPPAEFSPDFYKR